MNPMVSKLVRLFCVSTELTQQAQQAQDELLRSMNTWRRQA